MRGRGEVPHLWETGLVSLPSGQTYDTTSKPNDFRNNRLGLVTFNYDRSLEHYLYTAPKHRFNAEEAIRLIKTVTVIHVHGQLGQLPWQSDEESEVRRYTPERTVETVTKAAIGIKVISETIDDNPEFVSAHALMAKAKRIYLLDSAITLTTCDG